jgi:hypothetical protein
VYRARGGVSSLATSEHNPAGRRLHSDLAKFGLAWGEMLATPRVGQELPSPPLRE